MPMQAKHYVQFMQFNLKRTLVEARGSDSYFDLAEKLSLNDMIAEAEIQMYNLRNKLNYEYFEIRYGDAVTYAIKYQNFNLKEL